MVPYISKEYQPLQITATGRGQRNVVKTDKYGFPRINKIGTKVKAGKIKRVEGFQTGDIVNINIRKGKYTGIYNNKRLIGISSDKRGIVRESKVTNNQLWFLIKHIKLLQRVDGYNYDFKLT